MGVHQEGLEISNVVFDTLYTGGWMTKKINRLGLKWVGVLHPKTTVYYRNRRWSVASLGAWLRLKWRARLQRELITDGLPAPKPLRGKVAAAQLRTA